MLLNRPDLAARVLSLETSEGVRAAFHVYHRTPKGKMIVDPVFAAAASTPAEAEAFVLSVMRKHTIVGTVIPTGTI